MQYLFGLIVDFYINIVSGSEDDEKSIVMTKQAKMTEAIWERRILITPPRTSKNKEDDDAIEVYIC